MRRQPSTWGMVWRHTAFGVCAYIVVLTLCFSGVLIYNTITKHRPPDSSSLPGLLPALMHLSPDELRLVRECLLHPTAPNQQQQHSGGVAGVVPGAASSKAGGRHDRRQQLEASSSSLASWSWSDQWLAVLEALQHNITCATHQHPASGSPAEGDSAGAAGAAAQPVDSAQLPGWQQFLPTRGGGELPGLPRGGRPAGSALDPALVDWASLEPKEAALEVEVHKVLERRTLRVLLGLQPDDPETRGDLGHSRRHGDPHPAATTDSSSSSSSNSATTLAGAPRQIAPLRRLLKSALDAWMGWGGREEGQATPVLAKTAAATTSTAASATTNTTTTSSERKAVEVAGHDPAAAAAAAPAAAPAGGDAGGGAGGGGGAPYVSKLKFPDRFKDAHADQPLGHPELQPTFMGSLYGGPPVSHEAPVALNWVVTACNRTHIGRFLSSALLSGAFNGLLPRHITIVWCHPYKGPGSYPSILYNLRHSHSINIAFVSQAMTDVYAHMPSVQRTYLTALMVPSILGVEHLPLLITEEDVVFAPDANARIALALSKLPPGEAQDPYLIFLYHPRLFKPLDEQQASKDFSKADDDMDKPASDVHQPQEILEKFPTFGTQGMFMSGTMTALLTHGVLERWASQAPGSDLNQDMMIQYIYLDVLHCNTAGSRCNFYVVKPSIVEHIGSSSSIFGNDKGVNQRFHQAMDFPVRVALPGLESDDLWR